MNILFLGTTGVHHTLIAAYLYLNKPVPTYHRNMKFWDDHIREAEGYPLFIDWDEQHNSVYSLGAGKSVEMAARSIEQLVEILNYTDRDLIVKPISIKQERCLLFLHQLGRCKYLHDLIAPVIDYLLNKELATISRQIEEFKSQVRFA